MFHVPCCVPLALNDQFDALVGTYSSFEPWSGRQLQRLSVTTASTQGIAAAELAYSSIVCSTVSSIGLDRLCACFLDNSSVGSVRQQ